MPTSDFLLELVNSLEDESVSFGFLIEQLGDRTFGLTLLTMSLIALIPGASTLVGILIAWPALQMIWGRETPFLPQRITRREIAVNKLARALRIIIPSLRWLERIFRPRWNAVFYAFKRITGFFILLLGITLMSPFPFSHLIPAATIILLAVAHLEEDGICLWLALLIALISISITIGALWGTVETLKWIG